MSYTVSKIYSWTNISDTGCESKLDRFNDILSSFATEVYDLYPMKTIERFTPSCGKMKITTTHPIVKVRWFFWKWCNVGCSLDPKDCCAWFRRLLMEEYYSDNIDRNSYSVVWDNEIYLKLPSCSWITDAFVVYSRWFEEVKSMDDLVDVDRNLLSLLRLYMKSEYALESSNDINMSANYKSWFNTRIKKLQDMYANQIKYITPWAFSPGNQ